MMIGLDARQMPLVTNDLENLIADEEIEKATRSPRRNEYQTPPRRRQNLCLPQLLQHHVQWQAMVHEVENQNLRQLETEIGRQLHIPPQVLAVCAHVSVKKLLRSNQKRHPLQV